MDNKNKKKKSSKPLGFLSVIALALLGMFSDEIDNFELLVVVIVGLALVFVLILGLIYLLKKKAATKTERSNPFTHSHDRLNKQSAVNCSADEHWKIQLDGFLKDGIIDNNEYAVLLDRHGKKYDSTGF